MNGDLANFFGSPDGFDTHSVSPQEDFTVVPPGNYPIEIEKSEMKQTKSQNGHYLEITCTILDGPEGVKGRKLWDRLNLDNPSQQARDIALRTFAALGQALFLTKISDTQQIVDGRCLACVKVKDGFNVIRTYKPLPVGTTPFAHVVTPRPPAVTPAAAPVAPPVAQPVAPPTPPAPPIGPPVGPLVATPVAPTAPVTPTTSVAPAPATLAATPAGSIDPAAGPNPQAVAPAAPWRR